MGKEIIAKHQWLKTEPITYLLTHDQGKNFFWLGDSVLYLFSLVVPLSFFGLLSYISYLLAFSIFSSIRNSFSAKLIFSLVSLLGIYSLAYPSSHVFLFALGGSLVVILRRTLDNPRVCWYLVPLCLLWSNTDPSYIFVPGSVFLFFIAKPSFFVQVYKPLLFSLLMFFFSPTTYLEWERAFNYMQSTSLPIENRVVIWSIATLALGAIFTLPHRRSFVTILVLWIVLSYFFPVWNICLVFLCALILSEKDILSFLKEKFSPLRSIERLGQGALFLLIVFVIGSVHLSLFQKYVPKNKTEKIPWELERVFSEKTLPPRFFNDPSLGGFLSRLAPGSIFMDERSYRYSPEHYLELEQVRRSTKAFESIARRLNFSLVILDHRIYKNKRLLFFLSESPEWHLTYLDHIVVIFAKNSENFPLLTKAPIFENPRPEYFYARASAWLDLNEYEYAMKDLEEGSKLNPHLSDKYTLEGRIAILEGKTDEASLLFDQALRINKNDQNALKYHITNYLRKGNLDRLREKESLQKAGKWITKARQSFPEDPDFIYHLSQLTFLQGDSATTRSLLQGLLEKFPYYSPAEEFLQSIQKRMSEIELEEKLRKAIFWANNNKYEEALHLFEELSEEHPSSFTLQLEQGKFFLKQKHYDKALACFRKMSDLGIDNDMATCYCAMALAQKGDWKEAERLLLPIATRQEKPTPELLLAMRDIEEAGVKNLQMKIIQEPQNFNLRMKLATVFSRSQRFTEAIEVLEKFPIKNPSFRAHLYHNEANQLITNGKVKKGIAQLKKSLEIWPDFYDSHALLADIFLKVQKWDQAFHHFTALNRLKPENLLGKEGFALIELGKGMQKRLESLNGSSVTNSLKELKEREGKLQQSTKHIKKYLALSSPSKEKDSAAKRLANIEIELQKLQVEIQSRQIGEFFDQAIDALNNQKWETAIEKFQQILIITPNSPSTLFNLATAQKRAQQLPAAIKTLERLSSLQPDMIEVYLNLGNLYYQEKDFAQARKFFQLYIEKAPSGEETKKIKEVLQYLPEEK